MAVKHVFYSGNGTTPVDSGLPQVGRFFAIGQNGDLRFFQYSGNGEKDPTGTLGFESPNEGNQIGNGFQDVQHVLGGGDGIILAINPDGGLIFFQYSGNGEKDPTGTLGFEGPNQGTQIGNGFQDLTHVFVSPRQGMTTRPKTTIFAVKENGDLHWFQYSGNGEQDPTGTLGFEGLNQGNQIGNGFLNLRHIVGIGGGVFLAVKENGDLLYFRYSGNGEQDPTGTLGFAGNNPGNQIGNGFQNVRHLFGGSTDRGGRGHILFAVKENGGLHFFRYSGSGEQDPTGTLGFLGPNQGQQIGRGF
jgi:hypothetical protein